ncbi:MAG: CHASE domain-containing protein [Chthoniobacteraceae bacterium]
MSGITPTQDDRRKAIWLAITLLAVAIAGVLGAWYFAQQTAREQEEYLLQQARNIALATNSERVKKLNASPADLAEPAYLQLKGYYGLLKKIHPNCRSIALISRHASGRFFYYLNSEPADSPESIQPGSPFENAPKSYFRAYRSNVPVIPKPFPSGGKIWISAVVPVIDPVTTKPIALLVFTVDAQSIHAKVVKAALPPLLVTLSVVAVLGAAAYLIRRRSRQAKAHPWMWFLEPITVIIIGTQITLFWAWIAHEAENRNRAFENLAESKTATFTESLHYLRDSGLQGLASYFRSCAVVTHEGFQAYASYLTDARRFQAWDWVPVVAAAEKEKFERQIREQGDPGFEIWQNDARKVREPASGRDTYYPILYPAPQEGNERAVGFDLASEPLRRAALEEAIRFRLVTASEPLDLVIDNEPQRGLVILQPVFANHEPDRLRGFALAVLKIETALENTHPDPTVSIDWAFLQKDGTAKPVAANPPHPQPGSDHEFSYTFPIMAFGKVMLLTAHPGPEFDSNHPRRAGWLTLGVGFLFTFSLAIRAYAIVRKREELEQLVAQRTAALAASEARHRAMFEKNRSIELLIDPVDGRIMDANPAACEFYGYPRETMQTMGISQINTLAPRQISEEMEHARSQLNSGFHFQHLLACGAIRDVEVHSSPILVDNRELLYSIIHDITQRVQAERERQTMLQRFFTILSNMYCGVCLVTREDTVEFINEAFCNNLNLAKNPRQLMDLSSAQLFNRMKSAYLAPDQTFARIRGIIQENKPIKGEEIAIANDRTLQWDFIPLTIEGQSHGRMWLIFDITKRKQIEDELKRHANLINSLFNAIPEIIFFKDINGVYLSCNPPFLEFTGTTREQVIGRTDYDLFDRALADHFRKHDARAMEARQPIHVEEWVPYPGGTRELFETVKTPLRGPAGEILGIVGTSRSITERRRTEDALREAKEAAEAANRAKGDFLANMSHEIRTPMNAILGFAHLMQEDNAVPEHQKRHLEIITRSGNFLLSLINDILEMSKIEAGRTTLVPVPFDLHALLNDLDRIFLPQIEARHLRLIPPDLAKIPRRVIGDERKLRQILFNLLGNAVKFTFAGWIALRARTVETGDNALRLDIEVEDTGIGISQSDQSQLFQRFIQTESGRQVGGGTGLGLAITSAFVEIMGGVISVSSEVRKGSVFRFHVHLQADGKDEGSFPATHSLPSTDSVNERPEAPHSGSAGPISPTGLPADWIAAMREAVEAADYQQVEKLIEKIAAAAPLRAQQLRALADRFDADRLLGFLELPTRKST